MKSTVIAALSVGATGSTVACSAFPLIEMAKKTDAVSKTIKDVGSMASSLIMDQEVPLTDVLAVAVAASQGKRFEGTDDLSRADGDNSSAGKSPKTLPETESIEDSSSSKNKGPEVKLDEQEPGSKPDENKEADSQDSGDKQEPQTPGAQQEPTKIETGDTLSTKEVAVPSTQISEDTNPKVVEGDTKSENPNNPTELKESTNVVTEELSSPPSSTESPKVTNPDENTGDTSDDEGKTSDDSKDESAISGTLHTSPATEQEPPQKKVADSTPLVTQSRSETKDQEEREKLSDLDSGTGTQQIPTPENEQELKPDSQEPEAGSPTGKQIHPTAKPEQQPVVNTPSIQLPSEEGGDEGASTPLQTGTLEEVSIKPEKALSNEDTQQIEQDQKDIQEVEPTLPSDQDSRKDNKSSDEITDVVQSTGKIAEGSSKPLTVSESDPLPKVEDTNSSGKELLSSESNQNNQEEPKKEPVVEDTVLKADEKIISPVVTDDPTSSKDAISVKGDSPSPQIAAVDSDPSTDEDPVTTDSVVVQKDVTSPEPVQAHGIRTETSSLNLSDNQPQQNSPSENSGQDTGSRLSTKDQNNGVQPEVTVASNNQSEKVVSKPDLQNQGNVEKVQDVSKKGGSDENMSSQVEDTSALDVQPQSNTGLPAQSKDNVVIDGSQTNEKESKELLPQVVIPEVSLDVSIPTSGAQVSSFLSSESKNDHEVKVAVPQLLREYASLNSGGTGGIGISTNSEDLKQAVSQPRNKKVSVSNPIGNLPPKPEKSKNSVQAPGSKTQQPVGAQTYDVEHVSVPLPSDASPSSRVPDVKTETNSLSNHDQSSGSSVSDKANSRNPATSPNLKTSSSSRKVIELTGEVEKKVVETKPFTSVPWTTRSSVTAPGGYHVPISHIKFNREGYKTENAKKLTNKPPSTGWGGQLDRLFASLSTRGVPGFWY